VGRRKDAVYKENPQTLLEPKEFITNPIRITLPIELSLVFAIKIIRVDACLQASGGPFPIFVVTSVREMYFY
jgi:hypothetical protein